MRLLQGLLVASGIFGALASPSAVFRRDDAIPDPAPEDLSEDKILDQIITRFTLDLTLALNFPGLLSELKKLRKGESDVNSLSRAFLNSVKNRTAYKKAFAELDEVQQEQVSDFLAGQSTSSVVDKRGFSIPMSPAAKEHFKKMEEPPSLRKRAWLNAKRQTSPVIYEDAAQTKVMQSYVEAEFENWGLTVKNTPALTFVPTTVLGLKNLVNYAKANGKRVRGGGYRHTWTELFSQDDHIFVSFLDLKTATTVPDPSSLLPNSPGNANNEFKVIELSTQDVPGSGGKKRLARVGASVTNEEFRRWAIANNAWTLPLNVVMVEITLGGSNVPICHGGGLRHKTLSDLVRQIEYIDANGEHQTISDPRLLKAAAGSQGLLGLVTHVTFELDKMTYAIMKPEKVDVALGIPPPPGFTVPLAIRKSHTAAELAAAREKFVNSGTYDYYSEWFWFPYQKKVFINCWNATESSAGAYDYPTAPDVFSQWIQGWLGGVINDDLIFRSLPGVWQATFLGSLAMLAMPPQAPGINEEIRTYLIDALHFRRGVQNMRVRDIELQIPIPLENGKPNWTIVQQAWWDAIGLVYADPRGPMRIALEMRVMGGSDVILAPQKGNWGTASIEVLTTMAAARVPGLWEGFVQKIINKWMNYTTQGVKLNVRPHWAKEWDGYNVNGLSFREHVKQIAFKDQIEEFKEVMEEIGTAQGWTMQQAQARFSNPLWDDVMFS